MGRCICSVVDGDKRYFMIWSTVVDAPTTFGYEEEEFKEVALTYTGYDPSESMERAKEIGTSWLDNPETFDQLIRGNRAGFGEECLSKEDLIEWYCRRKENPPCIT